MKPTNFHNTLINFLTKYLVNERGVSSNTLSSYSDTFKLLIIFMDKKKKIPLKKLIINDFTKDNILEFLDYIEIERKCSVSTRNARLAAIKSYFKYIQYIDILNILETQKILSIRIKKHKKLGVEYLTVDAMKAILQQPDVSTKQGIRDLALLSLLYDSAARVSEMINLETNMVRLNGPFKLKLLGKGNVYRPIPVVDAQTKHLKYYMKIFGLDKNHTQQYPLFSNNRGEKFSRAGISNILKKYVDLARKNTSVIFPDKVTCHTIRHTRAMHLLQNGVDLVIIRSILGHVSVTTTEIYARADTKQKREAIESAYININPKETPLWSNNDSLITFLNNL
ncbi:tyrosine-type recombinase/integrase [Cellulophaga baltica]|uniref:tyrosine-type recombinase/integrase n=1 Tax=Cellulophaga baltica TaxID=76594 RepID=UPI002494F535|nr:tyrosine-type recombinase/integrase [Cellulophaga baltica]